MGKETESESDPTSRRIARTRVTFLLLIWIVVLGCGFWALLRYSNTQGEIANSTSLWPRQSAIVRNETRATLLIFAHPRCPCSAATIAELERLIPSIFSKVKTVVVFFSPRSKAIEWAKSDLWNLTQKIPYVETILDENGFEAAKFGAHTSGQAFLFGASGRLLFEGGITPGRGHRGDNLGRDSILHLVATGEENKIMHSPVFGCSLTNPERAVGKEI